jgi:general secretion pathway protein H
MDSRRGFTLIEVLAVLAIIGIAIALAQVRFARSAAQTLEDEAHRLALVLESARDEAMAQTCMVAWVSRSDSYRVGCRRAAEYASHSWPRGIALERASVAGITISRDAALLFTPSGINAPFELTLAMEGHRVLLNGDALGRVTVSK